MARTPWRCSQCGTVNEPVANSCRTCGRWPSLFDLQESAVGEVEQDGPAADEVAGHELDEGVAEWAAEPEQVETVSEATAQTLTDAGHEPAGRSPETGRLPARGRRQLFRLVLPIGVLVYVLITSYLHR